MLWHTLTMTLNFKVTYCPFCAVLLQASANHDLRRTNETFGVICQQAILSQVTS